MLGIKKAIAAAMLAVLGLTAIPTDADAQWRRRDRTVIIERDNGLNLNGGTLAAILAIQLARRAAAERETVVTRERSAVPREYVPLK